MKPAAATPARKRMEFPYGHGFFLQRLLLFTILVVFALVVLAFQLAAPAAWVGALGIALGVFVWVWGITPLFTNHWLTTTRLILRQGWYFRAAFPLREIESLEKFTGDVPLGLRARIGKRRLYVTGSRVGLLSIKLRTPRRFWAVLWAQADEIVFDVDSPDAFLEGFGGRKSSLAPVQAERADPYLRD